MFWHSSAHALGATLEQEIGSQLTVGPPVELSPKGSFFYDSYMGSETISETDYKVTTLCDLSMLTLPTPHLI